MTHPMSDRLRFSARGFGYLDKPSAAEEVAEIAAELDRLLFEAVMYRGLAYQQQTEFLRRSFLAAWDAEWWAQEARR